MKTYNLEEMRAFEKANPNIYIYLGEDSNGAFHCTKEDLCIGCLIDIAMDTYYDKFYYGSFTQYSYDYVCDNLIEKLAKYNYRLEENSTTISEVREKSYQLTTLVYFGKSKEAKPVKWYVPKSALRKSI